VIAEIIATAVGAGFEDLRPALPVDAAIATIGSPNGLPDLAQALEPARIVAVALLPVAKIGPKPT